MPIFAAAIFTSAFLLFWVQPLFAKMILPLLGGSPAVWATAMMFFQLVLLAGYGYAHLLTHRVKNPRGQIAVHGVVVVLGLAFLPFALSPSAAPPVAGSPIPWLLGVLAVSVGWPFFALSASAPLLQSWFARGHRDPYGLYAASNAGSLLALLAFPVLLEPSLTLAGQSHAWRFGYWALLVLLAAIAIPLLRRDLPALLVARETVPGWKPRLTWIVLAFVPSSLLLGVTTHITTDIASAPLFWVLPFALYLLSFIIAFARTPDAGWMLKLHAALITLIAAMTLLVVVFQLGGSVLITAGAHLAAFFIVALMCHAEMARRRPAASGLTSFYFCMAIGGALGGVFNALVAPAIFSTDLEYYLALVASCAVRLLVTRERETPNRWDVLLPLAPALLVAAVAWREIDAVPFSMTGRVLFLLPCALALYYFSHRVLRFTLGVIAVMGTAVLVQGHVDVLASERSFFGINKVRLTDRGRMVSLVHGTTLHGMEFIDPARRSQPLSYYARSGPVGQMFAPLRPPFSRAALVGLGTGALACYRRPGEDWTFFEIDGAVARLARDTRYFHYLERCPGAKIVLGDGRLSLQRTPDHGYDLIVIDAFSSDAIPTHLMTREAFALYLRKLKPHGIILFNLSNKYLRLGPVLDTVVASTRAFGRRELYYPSKTEAAAGASASEWMAIAADKADLDFLGCDPRWRTSRAVPGAVPWTDDFSNIFEVIQWWFTPPGRDSGGGRWCA